jgi:hypothetical protein
MYVAQCHAGFPMPLKAGKQEVYGVRATLQDATAAARLTLVDDYSLADDAKFGALYSTTAVADKPCMFVDERTIANTVGSIDVMFPEAIKLRRGVSMAASNLKGGTVTLLIR